jgi:hypothetical protein
MMIGRVVSGFMVRQMEYDADRHETRLGGSDTFESTSRQLVLLNFADHGAKQDLSRFYQEGRLADNLPRLIMANLEQMPPEAVKAVEEYLEKSSTGWFDTHPCHRDRVANAHQENAVGIFRLDQPATLLFRDFAETARGTTLDFYLEIFGDDFRRETIHPVEDLLARQGREIESYKALERYFQKTFSPWRPVRLARWNLVTGAEPEQAVERLRQAREALLADLPRYQTSFQSFDEGDTWQLHAEQGRALLDANLRAAKTDFPMPLGSRSQVSELQRSAAARQDETEPDLAGWETMAGDRLLTALDLLASPTIAERLPDSAVTTQECATLFRALAALEKLVGDVTRLRNTYASLNILLSKIHGDEISEAHSKAIRDRMAQLSQQLAGIYNALSNTSYPFDHAAGDISIAAYAVTTLPHDEDLSGLLHAGDAVLNTLPQLRARILGRLCQIAEEVEASLGLDPLPQPPKEEKPEA